MELYVIRHTTPDVDSGICYGQLDLNVTDSFIGEAEKVKLQLPESIDSVYSSPLKRCKQLAEYVYPGRAVFEPRILEYDFGNWEGLMWEDIPKDELSIWMGNYLELAPPNGETMTLMIDRIRGFLQDIAKKNSKKIAVFTHSGVIRVLHHLINHLPLKDIFSLNIDYGAFIRFQLTNKS